MSAGDTGSPDTEGESEMSFFDEFFGTSEPNTAQKATIERFVAEIEDLNPEWDVFNVEVSAFFDGDVSVTVETCYHLNTDNRPCGTRCYMFEVGRRGGAYLGARGRRYIRPALCEEARIY